MIYEDDKLWHCPDKHCPLYKAPMTCKENWEHLIKFHKANKKAPKYKKLEIVPWRL